MMNKTFDDILNETARVTWKSFSQKVRDKITKEKVSMCDMKLLWKLHNGESINGHAHKMKRMNLKNAGLIERQNDPTGKREANNKPSVIYLITPKGKKAINKMVEVINKIVDRINSSKEES